MKHPAKLLLFFAATVAILLLVGLAARPTHDHPAPDLARTYGGDHVPSVDHGKLAALQREFDDPRDVSRACASCHTERHAEVMASSHWNWEREAYVEGRGVTYAGKKNLMNNFCIGITGSEGSCTKCHVGYGWEEGQPYDFSAAEQVDCLVCHDQTKTYVKGGGMGGMPAPEVDLGAAARSVGRPDKANCGACHFFSGGGNNVKHGDLEKALLEADRTVDVHMGYDGVDLDCVSCHVTERHEMKGQLYSVSSQNVDRASCEDCHTAEPHADTILNSHTIKVACQTCHIPEYAKVNATKMTWDWSKAGKLRDGQPYHEEDADGNHTYLSIKGEFTWATNVQPDYIWFNGTADHYFLGDVVDTTAAVKMNTLHGSAADPDARIIPVKIHRGRQPYDPGTGMMIQPKLASSEPGHGAYWTDFDWDAAARAGMTQAGLPYSGTVAFVETEMTWPVNHMVAPANQAVSCEECHTPDGGRLAGIEGVYLPGRDRHAGLEMLGKTLLLLSLLAVIAHAAVRTLVYVIQRRR